MKHLDRKLHLLVGALTLGGLTIMTAPAWAQDPAPVPKITIELNTVSEIEGGCRLSFLAQNNLSADLDTLVLETVLFTREGGVDRLTLFDFQALPQGRPRVRQFDVSDLPCTGLGNILMNGVHACAAGEGDTEITVNSCTEALSFKSRTDHEVQG